MEGLALPGLARDLADEHDHRGGVLARDMYAGRSIGGARAARDEADAGPPGQLADRLRHHGGAAFLPAHRDLDIAIMERVEHGQIALAGNAERVARTVSQ